MSTTSPVQDPESRVESETTIRELNSIWCETIVSALVRRGVKRVLLCPGGRSAALVGALSASSQIEYLTHTDERSAAFIALGAARVSGSPVAVCTTSGSAVANLLPAALEAEKSGIPIVLLTCDRSGGNGDREAPQTADHAKLLAGGVRVSQRLPDADSSPASLEALDRLLEDAFAATLDAAEPGPLHLDIPLRGFYTSVDERPLPQPLSEEPLLTPLSVGERENPGAAVARALELRAGMRGLIVVGCEPALAPEELSELARRTRFPVLVEATSGLRTPELAENLVGSFDLVCMLPQMETLRTEIVIRTGLAPSSSGLSAYLAKQDCPIVKLEAEPRPAMRDYAGMSSYPLSPEAATREALSAALEPGDPGWRETWLGLENYCAQAIASALEGAPWGEQVAASEVCRAEGYGFLHLANSMSVRHGNFFCEANGGPPRVYGNRGVNGIDGNLATFLGELAAGEGPGLLLIGDLATLHDLPALEAAAKIRRPGAICVMNNGGGGLFALISDYFRGWDAVMRNPTDLDLSALAAGFGLRFAGCQSRDELREALASAKEGEGITVIELRVSPDSLLEDSMRLLQALNVQV